MDIHRLTYYFVSDVEMSGYSTRNKSGNEVIGPAAELPQSELPTLRDDILVLGWGE